MNSLSIFVDESGDFGAYNHITPYYIITMILHDQSMDISEQVRNLDAKVRSLGYGEKFAIHTAPLIPEKKFTQTNLQIKGEPFLQVSSFLR